METETNVRSFDRDIEDLRIYLAETYSTRELVYNRERNSYYLTGEIRKELEITEYYFLERVLIQSKLLRKDELEGLLSVLAVNTKKPQECLKNMERKLQGYNNKNLVPILKMHDDITHMIELKGVIEINYTGENTNTKGKYKIIPYDIEIHHGKVYVIAIQLKNMKYTHCWFRLDLIESFLPMGGLSSQEWLDMEKSITHEKKKSKPDFV